MILENTVREIERSQDFEEIGFSIKSSAKVFDILRNSLYSNKVACVIREYSCNAKDAHTLNNNQERPINIALPSYLEPTLVIRDFGPGLSHKDVFNVFVVYGESTKQNDNNTVGHFGIGAKSCFAYSPTFQVTSYHGGFKSIYNAYLSEDDCGKMALLVREESNEETGIEISVTIQEKDISQFIREAQNLFRFWKVKPIVSGNSSYKEDVPEFHLERADSWGFRKVERNANNISYIVMGGVPYVFNSSYVSGAPDVHKNLIDKNLVLFANIGDIDIAASRETAQATNKTSKWIINKLAEIENEVRAEIENKLSAATTEYEARKLYYQIFSGEGGLNVVKSLVGTIDITWARQKIENYCFKHNFKVHEIHIDNHYRTYKETIKVTQGNGLFFDFLGKEVFAATKIVPTLFYDLKDKGTGKLRKMGKQHLKANNFSSKETLTVLGIKDLSELTTWCAATGINFDSFSNIDDVIKLSAPTRLSNSSETPKGFNAQVYDPEDILEDKPDYEIITESGDKVELSDVEDFGAPKYYIIRNGKNIKYSSGKDIDLGDAYKILKEIDSDFAAQPVIYIFTGRYSDKVSGWKRVETIIKEKVKDIWAAQIDSKPYYGDALNCSNHEKILKLNSMVGLNHITSQKVLDFCNKMVYNRDNIPHVDFMSMNFYMKGNEAKQYAMLDDEFNKLLDSAPLLKFLNTYDFNEPEIINYINEKI